MEALLDRRTDGFSQGERMKTALARALVHDPDNIVLDEPTNGLDVVATRALREALRVLRDETGKCIVFSTHIMQEVERLCDRVVVVVARQARGRRHRREPVRAGGLRRLRGRLRAPRVRNAEGQRAMKMPQAVWIVFVKELQRRAARPPHADGRVRQLRADGAADAGAAVVAGGQATRSGPRRARSSSSASTARRRCATTSSARPSPSGRPRRPIGRRSSRRASSAIRW